MVAHKIRVLPGSGSTMVPKQHSASTNGHLQQVIMLSSSASDELAGSGRHRLTVFAQTFYTSIPGTPGPPLKGLSQNNFIRSRTVSRKQHCTSVPWHSRETVQLQMQTAHMVLVQGPRGPLGKNVFLSGAPWDLGTPDSIQVNLSGRPLLIVETASILGLRALLPGEMRLVYMMARASL